jgi:hypothetical protein
MANLETRWKNHTEYTQKCIDFPELDFCSYTPPEPEAHLYCLAVADEFNRHNTTESINYRCKKCLYYDDEYLLPRSRWIPLEVYMELIRNEVICCSYSPLHGKNKNLFCAVPMEKNNNNFWNLCCNRCVRQPDNVGKNLLFSYLYNFYKINHDVKTLHVFTNVWIDDLLGKNWFITNEIDDLRSALVFYIKEENLVIIYGLFPFLMDSENIVSTKMLKELDTFYVVKDSLRQNFTIKRGEIADILFNK